jgi:putative protein kinase ArgK-like GTPase of G3E family
LKCAAIASGRGIPYLECSGKTGDGLEKLMQELQHFRRWEKTKRKKEIRGETKSLQNIQESAESAEQNTGKLQEEGKENQRTEQPKTTRMSGLKKILGFRRWLTSKA